MLRILQAFSKPSTLNQGYGLAPWVDFVDDVGLRVQDYGLPHGATFLVLLPLLYGTQSTVCTSIQMWVPLIVNPAVCPHADTRASDTTEDLVSLKGKGPKP